MTARPSSQASQPSSRRLPVPQTDTSSMPGSSSARPPAASWAGPPSTTSRFGGYANLRGPDGLAPTPPPPPLPPPARAPSTSSPPVAPPSSRERPKPPGDNPRVGATAVGASQPPSVKPREFCLRAPDT